MGLFFIGKIRSFFIAFKIFKARVENETKKAIKTLRTDCGGECCSTAFNECCKNHGTHKELTAIYTPQQNDVSERKNRTILNMVKILLARGRMPKTFWQKGEYQTLVSST